MKDILFFTTPEKAELLNLYKQLIRSAGESIPKKDIRKLRQYLLQAVESDSLPRDNFGINPIIKNLQTSLIVSEEIGMKGSCLTGIMLHEITKNKRLTLEQVKSEFGDDVASIIKGLVKTNELYAKSPAIESENFRNLLLSFAEDMRVILIMIADRVNLMRQIKDTDNEDDRLRVANEAA
ncbi:MAG: HD domain-containing protein, partial [Bacteroides sp.]